MRTYDITLTISPDLPTWPGDPGVEIERVEKIEDGSNANVSRVDMGVHTGTHVDAPFHFLQDGKTVDQIDLSLLTGRAYVLHLPEVDVITAPVLENAQIPPRTRRVLFKTRNSESWAKKDLVFNTDFVGLSEDGAEYLVRRGVKLVGMIVERGLLVEPHQTLVLAVCECFVTGQFLFKTGF